MKQNNRPKYKQIIDAAIIVIAENGYHQAQVSKIAKQARVADGTIYLYFKNKEDILVSLFREKMGSFIREMEKEIPSKQTASEKLLMLIEKHFTLLAANNKLAIVTQLELRQSSKQLRYRINEILKRYLDIVDDIISFGKQAGEFDRKLNSRLARQMIFGTIDETVTTWVMNEQKYNLIELAKEVHELLIWGFRKRLFET
ncbi:TetR/AcrR family transcriptional regulator [Metabacillus fastidiosus]|uniref:TetR/AcrR family transcriptional regulator n=1 Tax=Metabacillus fastidiosus TaxID=1458 RepID=A0ABU6NVS4_9BACI|nr:TetR/AcrR family transcriptional regulator [Metabacillus fastidiosus]MED4401146.1 TetR/AcrR family transcriptional regulator [Metabacillus fastidiosus]MED4453278.1 TetR/AcrR family transcriptional regulator [Metabacillus fastidiosus]MED4464072.1 TetR/AcrR family transcriptional regulator [Metabacillus fastidiosus]